MVIWMGLLDEFQLEVSSFCTDLSDASVVIYIVCPEDRHAVARSERLELLEDSQELWSYLRKVQYSIYLYNRSLHLRDYGL